MDSATSATRVMLPNAVTKSLHSNARCSLPSFSAHPLTWPSRSITSGSLNFLAAGISFSSPSECRGSPRTRDSTGPKSSHYLFISGSADKIRRIIGIPDACIFRSLWIRAQRPGHFYISSRSAAFIFRSNNSGRGRAFLHPLFDSHLRAVMSVFSQWRRSFLSKPVRPRATTAVLRARRHVKTCKGAKAVAPHDLHHTLVVIDGVERRDRRIIPTVIHNQLAAPRLERRQVRVGGVQILCQFGVRLFHRLT